MKRERCFGIVPLTSSENGWRVFIVQHVKGKYWGFPKGRGALGESPQESAERELREETDMQVARYLSHSHLTQTYRFKRGAEWIEKRIDYYLAEVVSHSHSIDPAEIIQGKWISREDLLSHATFEEEEKLFQQVIKRLK